MRGQKRMQEEVMERWDEDQEWVSQGVTGAGSCEESRQVTK